MRESVVGLRKRRGSESAFWDGIEGKLMEENVRAADVRARNDAVKLDLKAKSGGGIRVRRGSIGNGSEREISKSASATPLPPCFTS